MYLNEDNEFVEVSYYKTETGETVKRHKAHQENGWVRITEYYEDGTVTETYERD